MCTDDVNDKEICYIMSMLYEFEIGHGIKAYVCYDCKNMVVVMMMHVMDDLCDIVYG